MISTDKMTTAENLELSLLLSAMPDECRSLLLGQNIEAWLHRGELVIQHQPGQRGTVLDSMVYPELLKLTSRIETSFDAHQLRIPTSDSDPRPWVAVLFWLPGVAPKNIGLDELRKGEQRRERLAELRK